METGQRIRRERWERRLMVREIWPIDEGHLESGEHC
jgi:hypothetical protein